MNNWQEFEKKCEKHLNEVFSDYAEFTTCGGEDSTTSDIEVKTAGGEIFYIEVKEPQAQCGQFVLFPDDVNKKFLYSSKNKTPINKYSDLIIQYMDNKFENFKNAGTSGREINFPNKQAVFANWIIDYYKAKGVKFFITDKFVIFPIDEFGKYFNISAKYRVKKSGSQTVGKNRIPAIKAFLETQSFGISSYKIDAKSIFVKSSKILKKTIFSFNGDDYIFSEKGEEYEIRKLSKTFNANVIFSITFNGLTGLTDSEFILQLQNK